MRHYQSIFIIVFLFLSIPEVQSQYITIDDQLTASKLVTDVLVNSPCVSISGSTAVGDTLSGISKSFAYFNANGTTFPFKEGVVLSTARAVNSSGPYTPNNRGEGDKKWKGDADLDVALGISSINATVLEFDFIALTNTVSFNYLFASNEYQSYFPCSFSDGFAFLIKEVGSTDPYKNLAVLPNSNTIVSSQNVRPLIKPVSTTQGVFPGCPALNENYFSGFNSQNNPINYAGQTVVLNASTNVIAGKTYHIKLVIADDREQFFDSAVFVEAGSFKVSIDLGQDYSLANNNPVCFGEKVVLDTKLSPTSTFKWSKDGIVIPGANQYFYEVSTSGNYKVSTVLGSSSCEASDEIKVEFSIPLTVNDQNVVQCDDNGDGISIFNLTKIENELQQNDTSIATVSYYENLADAEAKTNAISNPNSYINKTPAPLLYFRAENKFGCYAVRQLQLLISNTLISAQAVVQICDSDAVQDGFSSFDLNAQVSPQLLSGLPSNLEVGYYLTENDAIIERNALPNNFINTVENKQSIFARIINGSDCYDITPIQLLVNTFDPVNFEQETQYICSGSSIDLSVADGFASYLWNTGATQAKNTVTVPGTYSVTVTNLNGCSKSKIFSVQPSEVATLTNITIKDFAGSSNAVTVEYSGSGSYAFSLDGDLYQDEATFTNLTPNKYIAYVRDKNGCGTSVSNTFYVLDYPRFFTPNGDGYNDVWRIENDDYLPDYHLSVFDRYGKLLKQMPKNNLGWNGLFAGKQLPADDYWFTLQLNDGRMIKGHFSLKR